MAGEKIIKVKIQRPLASNEPQPPWLVYDETRKHCRFIPVEEIDPRVIKAIGSDLKIYFRATYNQHTGFTFLSRLPPQNF